MTLLKLCDFSFYVGILSANVLVNLSAFRNSVDTIEKVL